MKKLTEADAIGYLWVGAGNGPGHNWSGGTVMSEPFGQRAACEGGNGDQSAALAPSAGGRSTAERLGERIALVTSQYHDRIKYVTERKTLA